VKQANFVTVHVHRMLYHSGSSPPDQTPMISIGGCFRNLFQDPLV